jgi:hypothetical protein
MKLFSMRLKILEHLYNYLIFIILNIFSQSKQSDNSGDQKLNSNEVR